MKPYFSYLFLSLIFIGVASTMSGQANAKSITIHVENIDTNKPGNLMILLYEQDGFPKEHAKAIDVNVVPANKEKITVNFPSAPPEFAIKVLHDEDESGQVTKNWTGLIPAEGLGFSNDARLSFGPPKFKQAKVDLEQIKGSLTIKMIYP